MIEKRALFGGISFDLYEHLQDILCEYGIKAAFSITVTKGMHVFAKDNYHIYLETVHQFDYRFTAHQKKLCL